MLFGLSYGMCRDLLDNGRWLHTKGSHPDTEEQTGSCQEGWESVGFNSLGCAKPKEIKGGRKDKR